MCKGQIRDRSTAGSSLEHRRRGLGLSRRELAEQSGPSYPYVSQLETGDRDPALKAMRALAPVLDVRPEEFAPLVAGGEWATTGSNSYESAPDAMMLSAPSGYSLSYNRDNALLSLERIALLSELIAAAVEELGGSSRTKLRRLVALPSVRCLRRVAV